MASPLRVVMIALALVGASVVLLALTIKASSASRRRRSGGLAAGTPSLELLSLRDAQRRECA